MSQANDQSRAGPAIESVRVLRLGRPVEPPLVSGIHHIDRIEMNVVEISAGGETGVGYTYAFSAREAESVTPLVLHLGEVVVGADPGDPAALTPALWSRINFIGRAGPPVMALSAIDVALWDLHARLRGVPLHEALGLPSVAQPVYAAAGSRDLPVEALVAEALGFQERGFRGFKLRIGDPDWRADVARVAAVREAIGPGMDLMVDANQAWDEATAIRAASAMAPLDLAWFEEPVDAEDHLALAAVRAAAPMPIAAGETGYGAAPLRAMVAAGCLDVLQPDLMRCGGISGFLEVAAIGARSGLEVAPHLFVEIAPHLAPPAGAPPRIELLPGWFEGIFDGEPEPRDGLIEPGAAPGLGLALSEQTLAEHLVGVFEL